MKKLLLSLGIPLLFTPLCGCSEETGSTYTITFFNVGKADAILLQYEDTNMVIDTGTTDSSEYFLAGLEALNVDEIDVLLISHFDQDHVGGAADLINTYTVKEVYQTYEVKTSTQIAAYKSALTNAGITPTTVSEEFTFKLGSVSYTVYPPLSDTYDNSQSNNSSLCVKATYGSHSYLFPGDAEKDRIKELNSYDISADVLKVPHHGGVEDNSNKFFKNVAPTYAIITDSEDEPADSEVITYLTDLNVNILYTKDGDITITSDGSDLVVSQ